LDPGAEVSVQFVRQKYRLLRLKRERGVQKMGSCQFLRSLDSITSTQQQQQQQQQQ
jgi:hypothetical protein